MDAHRAQLSPVQTSRARPLLLAAKGSPHSPAAHGGSFVGPPVNLLKSSPSHALQGRSPATPTATALVAPMRKQRPATAVAGGGSSSSTMIQALMAGHGGDDPQQQQQPPPPLLPHQRHPLRSPPADPTVELVAARLAQRCAGCGAYAELCLACCAQLKRSDGAAYKRQLARAVEVLFERATARAFTKMAHVILQWIFGTWKRETLVQKRRRALAVCAMETRRLQRLWRGWHTFIYERRILGAMLYAQEQQHATRDKTREIAQLHGDLYEVGAASRLRATLQGDAVGTLQRRVDAQQRSLQSKTQELLALRRELHDARARIARLETQAIDPRELERIRAENADAKKMVFQLAAAALQTMETQFDVLATSEGRQNLNGVLSKEVAALLDRPEHPSFFNPLVELTAAGDSASSLSGVASFDAPVDRADRVLLQWVNALLARGSANGEWLAAPRVANFHASLCDGRAFAVLTKVLHAAMCRVRPKRPPGAAPSKLEAASVLRENGEELTEIAMERYVDHVKREDAPAQRLALLVTTIGQALWLPKGLLAPKDVLAGDAELNFATLSYLFCTFSPCLEDAHYALCHDLKAQLASAKAKWRELRDGALGTSPAAPGATGSAASASTMVALAATAGGGGGGRGSAGLDDAALSAKLKLAVAQTLELKKKLEAEDARAREGHLLWWKSARVVLRKCFLSYARLARGKAGVLSKLDAALQDENEVFSRLPSRARLADLELPFEDAAWEAKLLQSYLGTVHCDLARIYRGYATRADASGQFMSVADLTELLTECRVVDGLLLTEQDVQHVVRKLDPKLTGSAVSPTRSVTPSEFLEALVRTARRKYSGEHHRVTLSEAFCLLVDNFILPFAFRADADVFRKQLEDPKIRRLLLKFADELRELYASYAVEDARRRPRKRARMTAFTFSQCMLDRNVQDVAFNGEKVRSVVQRVARTAKKEEAAAVSQAGGDAAAAASSAATGGVVVAAAFVEEDELTFEEFEEAVIVAACYKFPDPYSSIESRVEKFLTFYVRGNGASASGGGAGDATGGKTAGPR